MPPLAAAVGHLARSLTGLAPDQRLWTALRSLGPALDAHPIEAAPLGAPTDVTHAWAADRRRTRAANVVLVDGLERALSALAASGITPILIKGAAVLDSYDDLSLRPMDDADLLVRPSERKAALALLQAEGFRVSEPEPGRFDALGRAVPAAATLRQERGAVALEIDLHWATVADPRLIAAFPGAVADGIWARSEIVRIGATPARRPHPIDAVLATALAQVLWHPWSHPLGYLDIHLLATRFGPTDWQELTGRAIGRGVGAPLYWGLVFTTMLFGTEIPSPWLERLAPGRVGRALAARLIGDDWIGRAPHRREQAARDLLLAVLAGPTGVARMLRATLGRPRASHLSDSVRALAAMGAVGARAAAQTLHTGGRR